MHPPEEVDRVRALAVGGLNASQIARAAKSYASLLGIYLGGGTISTAPKRDLGARRVPGHPLSRDHRRDRARDVRGDAAQPRQRHAPRYHELRGNQLLLEIMAVPVTAGGTRPERGEYPRYFFSNHPLDIQQLFRDACDLIGVEYRNNRWHTIGVARRDSVALLDTIVGPKT